MQTTTTKGLDCSKNKKYIYQQKNIKFLKKEKFHNLPLKKILKHNVHSVFLFLIFF